MMNVVESVKDKASGLLSSAGELNRLVVDKMEEAVGLNISAVTFFTKVGFKQLRSLSGVRDLKSVQKFISDSSAASDEVAKKLRSDTESWLSLWGDTKDRALGIIKIRDDVGAKKKPAAQAAAA